MESLQLLTLYLTLTPILSGRKAKINLHTTPILTVAMPIGSAVSCHARIQEFSSEGGGEGGPRQSDKKALTTLFVCCCCFFFLLFLLSSAYFTEVKWLISKKIIIFQGSGGGLKFSRGGGSNFFHGGGGVHCLFPIETHITCHLPGGVRTPCPHLDPHLAAIYLVSKSAK